MSQNPLEVGSAHPTECRLLIAGPTSGAWNMGLDEALLFDAAANGKATLRFYQWDEPTLSLGYFQDYDERHQHAASRECAVVRRQTGGGAILHERELTYSLTLPTTHPLARRTEQVYAAVHDSMIAALKSAADWPTGWALVRNQQTANVAPRDEPFLCFERRARGDVLMLSGGAGGIDSDHSPDWKILGSAQRRHRGAVLQHGSLLLERSPEAPELPGIRDLAGIQLDALSLAREVSVRLAFALGLGLEEGDVPAELKSKALEIANAKYRAAAWTKRR